MTPQWTAPPDQWLLVIRDGWPIAFWIVTLAMTLCIVSFGILGGPPGILPRLRRFLAALAIFSILWLILIQTQYWLLRILSALSFK
jgi:hypothetical protein